MYIFVYYNFYFTDNIGKMKGLIVMIKKVYNHFLKMKNSLTNSKFLLKKQMRYLENKQRKLSKDVLYTDKAFIIHKYKHMHEKHRQIKKRLKKYHNFEDEDFL